jgi:two-component system, NtrC family, sensor kinase
MLSHLRDISLRAKIMLSFVLIVLSGTAVSTLIGSRIIAKAMLNEALKRVQNGLDAASVMYTARLDSVSKSVVWAASAAKLAQATTTSSGASHLPTILDALRKENNLHFLAFVDTRRGWVTHGWGGGGKEPSPGAPPYSDFISGALAGKVIAGTEILSQNALSAEDPALVNNAVIWRGSAPSTSGRDTRSGLVLLAAAPVYAESELAGVLYGGILLNRNYQIVDQIKQVIYGGEATSPDQGTVSIFLRDTRVSTNVMSASGERATGTAAEPEFVPDVLTEGKQWYGRVLLVGEWSIAASQPLRDHNSNIVGMLQVSMPEKPYLAVRTDMMLSFLVVAAAGVLIVLGLTYLITRTMIHPLEEIVAASNRIAAGDLDHSVRVHSSDEIGHLARSFNEMVDSIKAMKLELEEWGRTLEQKVEKRTEELVTVQAQMAQSAKMASLGRLAAGVAHEINNPLGGILTFSMLALEECDEEHPMRQNLEIIVKQTLRCRETVKGLLDFARQSSQAASKTDVNAVVDKTLSLLEGQSIFQNVRTVRNLQPSLPPALIDAGQLQQVVVNIVLNAVDAMEETGTLTVETCAVPDSSQVLLKIGDTGKGISDDIMPYIFEPFFTTKKVGKGTGLGLSIVHGIVTRAGGKVEVRSSKKGTTFTVRLVIAEEDEKSGVTQAAETDALK